MKGLVVSGHVRRRQEYSSGSGLAFGRANGLVNRSSHALPTTRSFAELGGEGRYPQRRLRNVAGSQGKRSRTVLHPFRELFHGSFRFVALTFWTGYPRPRGTNKRSLWPRLGIFPQPDAV